MCTATWMSGDGFRCLLFNRDERRSRLPEIAPEIFSPTSAPKYLAPVDPESGGTWIAANEYGLSAAVLNDYESSEKIPKPDGPDTTSRGTLPLAAVSHSTIKAASEAIHKHTSRNHFQPFKLILQDPKGDGQLLSWNGEELAIQSLSQSMLPLTTSSWRGSDVVAYRKSLYERITGPIAKLHELLEFHGTFDPENPGFGPAMSREETSTRSLCVVRIGNGEVSLRHQLFEPSCEMFTASHEVALRRRFPQ